MSYLSKELQQQIEALNKPQSQRQDSADSKGYNLSPALESQLNQVKQTRYDSVLDRWSELGFSSRLNAELFIQNEADAQQRKDAQDSITQRRRNASLPQVELKPIGHQPEMRKDVVDPKQSLTQRRKSRKLPDMGI